MGTADHARRAGVTVGDGPAIRPRIRGTALGRRSLLQAFGALGATAAAGPLLAACSSAEAAGRTSIRFEETKPEVVPYFDTVVAQFNRSQSGVTASHDFTSSLIAEFVRGNPPDLDCDNFNINSQVFVTRGVLTDLSDMPEAKAISPAVQALITPYQPGQVNALPYSVAAEGVVYNIDLFEKHGVEVPTTWSQLIAACETFRSAGVTPVYGTYKDSWTLSQGLFDYVGGGSVDVATFFEKLTAQGSDIGPDSEVSFERTFGPAAEKMLQLAAYCNGDAASRGYADGNAAFAAGKGAMYLQGPWAIGEIATANPKLKVGCFPLPATDDAADTKCMVNLDLACWIPVASRNQKAARTMLSYLMRPSVINTYNKVNLAFSPLTDAPTETDARIAGLEPYVRAGKSYPFISGYIPTDIPINNYVQQMVLSKKAPAALRSIDDDWRRLAKRLEA